MSKLGRTRFQGALNLTPAPGSGIPSPEGLRRLNDGELSNLLEAPTIQVQSTLLEWLIQNHARAAGPAHFFPLIGQGEGGAVGFSETNQIRYAVHDDHAVDAQGESVASDQRILDAELARRIGLPPSAVGFSGPLPDRLPTVPEWENSHPILGGLAHAAVLTGHEPPPGNFFSTGDYFTYFEDMPYPPANPHLRAVFERCVPEILPQEKSLLLSVFSPLHVSFVDAKGRQLGFDAHGKRHLEVPGGLLMKGHPELYMVPPGSYSVHLTATGTGTATLMFTYPGRGAVQATRAFTLRVRRGQSGTLRVNRSAPATSLRFAGRVFRAAGGLAITIRGLPKRFKIGKRKTSVVRVVDQTGRPAVGAVITVTAGKSKVIVATDSTGSARITLIGRKGGMRVTAVAPSYLTARTRITGFR